MPSHYLPSQIAILLMLGVSFFAHPTTPADAQPAPTELATAVNFQPRNQDEADAASAYLQRANARHEVPTTVHRAIVVDNYALVDWQMGETGGQVVLMKAAQGWQILRGMGGVLGAAFMQQMGVPEATAHSLATQWQAETAAVYAGSEAFDRYLDETDAALQAGDLVQAMTALLQAQQHTQDPDKFCRINDLLLALTTAQWVIEHDGRTFTPQQKQSIFGAAQRGVLEKSTCTY